MRLFFIVLLSFLLTDLVAQRNDRIVIACKSSISDSGAPLIVVHGIPYPEGRLDDLDPSSVTAVSIIRDASAVALYGQRAVNGVVIVTTTGKGIPPADYTLYPPQLPPDVFTLYEEQLFGGEAGVRWFLNGKRTKLRRLQRLRSVDVAAVRVYTSANKRQMLGAQDVGTVVRVQTRD